MLEIGVRVVRGPDWKWGNQVMCHITLFIQFYANAGGREKVILC